MPKPVVCPGCGGDKFKITPVYVLSLPTKVSRNEFTKATRHTVEEVFTCFSCQADLSSEPLKKGKVDIRIVANDMGKMEAAVQVARYYEGSMICILKNQKEAIYLQATLGCSIPYTTLKYYKNEMAQIRQSPVVFCTQIVRPMSFYISEQNYVLALTEKEAFEKFVDELQLKQGFGTEMNVNIIRA